MIDLGVVVRDALQQARIAEQVHHAFASESKVNFGPRQDARLAMGRQRNAQADQHLFLRRQRAVGLRYLEQTVQVLHHIFSIDIH